MEAFGKPRAGGVVWRLRGSEVEIAVIHPRGASGTDWSLPRGRLRPGEPPSEAAIREVEEETGYRVRRGPLVGSVVQHGGSGRPKVVSYWLMTRAAGRFRPNREVDDLRWLGLDEAAAVLTGRPEAALVPRIRELLTPGLEATG